MQYNPDSDRDVKKLRDAMGYSRKLLHPYQARYVDIWRHYAAKQHDEDDFDRMLPMNLVRMAIDIWSRGLSSKTPRVLVNSVHPGLKPRAYELQLATDHLLREIRFDCTLRSVVKSALAMMGILKVGLTDPTSSESQTVYHDEGQPFADNVLFGDWIHDMNARHRDEWEFCGNRYRVPLSDVKGNPAYENTENLGPSGPHEYEEAGAAYDYEETHVESVTQGRYTLGGEEYIEHLELWDVWLPRENLVITIPCDGGKPIRVVEWEGPERGPYHILSFGEIPGNVIPTGAVGGLFDIHDLMNRLFVKLGDQAERQKTTFAATQAATADGSAMARIDAADGEVISTAHPDAVREMRSGGVDQQGLAFVGWLRGIGSYMGGNLDTLGGLQKGADTLGQEKLLQQQSSGLMNDMQGLVESFSKDVITDLSWWQYTNPALEVPLLKKTATGQFEMPFTWGPERREANFFEYAFDITPFSSAPQNPREKLQFLSNFVRQEVLPMAQAGMLQQSGINFDPKEYFRVMAQYADMPEINCFLKVGGASLPAAPAGLEAPSPGMPNNTTREYVRRNESANPGMAGMDREMMQGAMGASMPQGTGPSMMPQGE